ncbi:MAG: RagB/SusD family nutrient uptake outer membrane protein, partial [Odoribacter sp.]
MKKYIYAVTLLVLSACDARLDQMKPHNMSDADTYLKKFENIVNATSGLYAQFYAQTGGFTYDYVYEAVYHVLGEFRGNNMIFAEAFEDKNLALGGPDAYFYLYSDQKAQSFAWPMWARTNQIILGASKNIQAIEKLESEDIMQVKPEKLQRLKGESYFIRGLFTFNSLNVFGRPYWDEPDKNPGIPLDTLGSGELLPRSSVKDCFNSIIRDFTRAASCLPDKPI